MTRTQQIALLVILLVLFVVLALLAVTLLNLNQAASPEPTAVGVLPTGTATRLRPSATSVPTVAFVPTWTMLPTSTAYPTNTPRPTHTATSPPTASSTFAPTFTPRPTEVITATPAAPTGTMELQNPGFEGISENVIPGWSWWAEDNFEPGGEYNSGTSYDTPLFKQADDPVRRIDGPTLQIDGERHLKFKVHVFQTVVVSPSTTVNFQVLGSAFSDVSVIQMAAGLDPAGGPDCTNAQWGEMVPLDQEQGVLPLAAPEVQAGEDGRVTVCLYAEPLYPAVSNAAFFDSAELMLETNPFTR